MSDQICTVDSYVKQDNPSANYGTQPWLRLFADLPVERAFLYFPVPFPIGAAILSATLTLRSYGSWDGAANLTCERVVGGWAENTLCWNNQPTVSGVNAASVVAAPGFDGAPVTFDVKAMLQDAANGAPWFGFRIVTDDDTFAQTFRSANDVNPSLRPLLSVTYSVLPGPPTRLAPDGGQAVIESEPFVYWQGSGDQTALQVQTNDTADFSSPDYDSGVVTSPIQNFHLSSEHGFAGLSDEQFIYWRVRIATAAGWSSWSSPAYFGRRDIVDVEIDDPSPGALDSPTPVVSWHMVSPPDPDHEQARWRVNVLEVRNSNYVLVHTAAGTVETSYAIPPHVIHTYQIWPGGDPNAQQEYLIEVRAWDFINRWGDEFASTDQTNWYIRTSDVDGIDYFTVHEPPGTPKVELTWQRTGDVTPTAFNLLVDGNDADSSESSYIDPASHLLPVEDWIDGRPTYRMTYWGLTPRVQHVLEMEAVDYDVGLEQYLHSEDNIVRYVTLRPIGIWLMDPADNLAVMIAGNESADVSLGETAQTFSPLGSRRSVRVVDSIRGYEGGISGILLSEEDRDIFLTLKIREKTLRLMLGDLNIPIRLSESRAIPTPTPGDNEFICSFSFFQDGPPWPDGGQFNAGENPGLVE